MDVLNESDSRVALVTGANRGIGLATVRGLAERGYTTLRYARDLAKGERAAAELARAGVGALPCEVDVTDRRPSAAWRTRCGPRTGGWTC
jgi:NAD(P)-dependent dehydrogenase (short-subunit alcohol dehydrogenase family)